MGMEEEVNIYLSDEEIENLVDGEYYWIAYQFPKADDEIWDVGVYNKKFLSAMGRIAFCPTICVKFLTLDHENGV